jgi:2-polyprenyl-6-methoxyphenol hydroxylase-like FAD-dependent oxidoreductase
MSTARRSARGVPRSSSPPSDVRVVVVGGGIGGLSVAIALRRAAIDTTVLERTSKLEAAGAGITLFGNAMRGLEQLGVRDAVAERSGAARRVAILTSDGGTLSEMPPDLFDGSVATHRGDLQAVLAEAAGELRLNSEVTSVEDDDRGVRVLLADGSEERGDLVIGADGVQSAVRRQLWSDSRPRYAGYTAWRGVTQFTLEEGWLTESWGRGQRFGLVDLGDGRTYWFATKNAQEGEQDEPSGRRAELLRRFSAWHEPVRRVLESADEGSIIRNDVYYLDPLETWSRGRVVLLGDAAHATTPRIGQGAAQAIEDAVALARAVDAASDLAPALHEYEARRRARAALVLEMSRRADRAGQLDGRLACAIRNAIVRLLPAAAQRRQLAPIVNAEP